MEPEHRPETARRAGTVPDNAAAHEKVDPEDLADFYRYAAPRIVKVLVKTTNATIEEAGEATHTSIIEAGRAWHSIETNRLAWCITVAKRHWGQRKYSADASFEEIPPESPLLRDASQDVVRRVEARLRLDETLKRMELLTSREREVLDLHLGGLSTSAISDYLG